MLLRSVLHGLTTEGETHRVHLKQNPIDASPVLICFAKVVLAERHHPGVEAINPFRKVTHRPFDSTSSFSVETVLVPEPVWS